MVELSGLTICDEQTPDGDIEIAVIGLRAGEKLYEELLISNNPQKTDNPRIMKAHEDFIPWHSFIAKIDKLKVSCDSNDLNVIKSTLVDLVSGYVPGKSKDV